jgi:hypothetical protein
MTFTDAAAQVLRLVGKPLHYKEITDVAIERNLLSHVGKSPEVTMGARLAALVKKSDKDTPLIRVKPGVFALREWDPATVEKGLQDRTPALERLAAQHPADPGEPETAAEAEADAEEDASGPAVAGGDGEGEPLVIDAAERERAALAAGANAFFASEEDDDEPIFGREAPGEPSSEGGDRGAGADGTRRRRRRRRRGRGGEERAAGDGLPSYTVSDAPTELGGAEIADEPRAPAEPLVGGHDSPPERTNGEAAAGYDELAGRSLADGLFALLSTFDRHRGPVALQTLVDAAQRRGRFFGEHAVQQGVLAAAAKADNARALARGARPRFRVSNGRVGLTEWALDGELLRLEREIHGLAERYREAARRAILRQLQELPQRALGELMLLLLEHVGFSELVPVRRPGAHGAELHLSGWLKTPAGEMRTAVVARRDGREIGRERVTELRGAFHHYGPAHAAWILTTGQVLSGAREEASSPGASPVTVVDGIGLARLCEEHGVGVVRAEVPLLLPDLDLLDGLRAS